MKRPGGDFLSGPFLFYPKEETNMGLKYSTGLRNFLVGEGSLRKAFEDGQLLIYTGAAPANADDAPLGVLLAKITNASGAVALGARSTPKREKVVLGCHGGGATV